MSLQKKCLTASAVTHGLLLLLVFIGSAFIPQKPKFEGPEFEIFTLPSDFELVAENNVFSGGNPNARDGSGLQPQPQPQQPKVQTPPPQQPKPEPQKAPEVPAVKPPPPKADPVKPVEKPAPVEKPKPKIDPDDFKISKAVTKKSEPKKQEPTIDFSDLKSKIEKRTVKTQPKANSKENTERDTKYAANAFAEARKNLEKLGAGGSPAGRGNVDDILGPGGARVASYNIYLAGIYRGAWVAPGKSAARSAVRVRVTISRDGTVLSSEVLDKSGNREFDRAADATVRRVRKFDRPPPTTEPSVTYTLEFTPE